MNLMLTDSRPLTCFGRPFPFSFAQNVWAVCDLATLIIIREVSCPI